MVCERSVNWRSYSLKEKFLQSPRTPVKMISKPVEMIICHTYNKTITLKFLSHRIRIFFRFIFVFFYKSLIRLSIAEFIHIQRYFSFFLFFHFDLIFTYLNVLATLRHSNNNLNKKNDSIWQYCYLYSKMIFFVETLAEINFKLKLF